MSYTCAPGARVLEKEYPPEVYLNFDAPTPAQTYPAWEVALKISFYVLAIVLDLAGNSLVVFIVAGSKKMRTPTNVLLVNLAVADILVALLCMWVHLGASVTSEWPFGLVICKLNMFAQVSTITSSVLTLTIISVERFVAIVFPLRPGFSLRLTGLLIAVVWIIACAIAAPQLHFRYVQEVQWRNRHVITCQERWPLYWGEVCPQTTKPTMLVYHMFAAIVMFFVPIVVMIICYTVICVCLMVRKSPASGAVSDSHYRAKRKVVRMLVIVVMTFVACWTPLHVIELDEIFRDDNAEKPYMETVRYVVLYVAYCNSAVNPILYAGFNENFRRCFQDVFTNGCLPFVKRRNILSGSRHSRSGVAGRMTQRRTKLNAVEPATSLPTALVKLEPGHRSSQLLVKLEPGHSSSQLLVKAEPGHNSSQMVVKSEPGHDSSQMLVKVEPGHDSSQMLGKAEPGHDSSQMLVKAEPGHDSSQMLVKAEPGHDSSQMLVKEEPGHDSSQMLVKEEPGHDSSQMLVKAELGHDSSQMLVKAEPGHDSSQMLVKAQSHESNQVALESCHHRYVASSGGGKSEGLGEVNQQMVLDPSRLENGSAAQAAWHK